MLVGAEVATIGVVSRGPMTDIDITYSAAGLIEVKGRPRWVVFLQPDDVLFQEFESVQKRSGRQRNFMPLFNSTFESDRCDLGSP